MSNQNPTKKGKCQPKNQPKKTTKTKKKRNPEMLYRLEYLEKISKITSEYGINNLSSFYGTSMKTLGKKCVYRIDPKVKRNFCRKCSTAFTPNFSCDINVIEHPKELSYVNCRCRTCGNTRKYILDPKHKLWETNPDWVIKIHEEILAKQDSVRMEVDSDGLIKSEPS